MNSSANQDDLQSAAGPDQANSRVVMTDIDPAQAIGRRLAEARCAAGLDEAEIAARLKLGVAKIQAIEAGELHRLAGLAVAKATLRAYARALRVDIEILLAALREGASTVPLRSTQGLGAELTPTRTTTAAGWGRHGMRSRVWRWMGLMLTAGLVAGWAYQKFSGVGEKPVAGPVVQVAIPLTASVSAAGNAGFQSDAKTRDATPDGAAVAVQPAVPAFVQAATVTSAVDESGAHDTAQLDLQLIGNSWVEVTDYTGKILVQQTYGSGAMVRVVGSAPLKLTINNPTALMHAEYRGRPLDLKIQARSGSANMPIVLNLP